MSSSGGNLDVEHPGELHSIHCTELDGYGTDIGYIMTIVLLMCNYINYNPDFQNILLPLLTRFRYTDEYLSQKNICELVALHQNIFLTIIHIENYILGVYSLSLCNYSSEILTKYFKTIHKVLT